MVLTATDGPRLDAAARQLRAHGAGLVRAVVADLRDPRERRRLVDMAGPVDILVNNAGVLGLAPEALWRLPVDVFEGVMHVNTTAVFDLIRQIVPGMIERGSGTVINVSSSVGVKGRAGWGAYAVSKFAVEGLSQTLAADLHGTGVRCVVINPGGTRTDMRAQAKPDEDPLTLPQPADITAPFVAAAAADIANGARLDARDWLVAPVAS